MVKNKDRKNHHFDYKGSNWLKEKLAITLFFGFNEWKRDMYVEIFPEQKTLFLGGGASLIKIIKYLLYSKNISIVRWGKTRINFFIRVICFIKKISITEVEDGFIRSNEYGKLHSRPSSLCIDNKSIYYDAKRETNIEKLLNEYDYKKNPNLIKRAKKAISLFETTELSKYYDPSSFKKADVSTKKSYNYSILIIGQVEDDASITYGATKIKTNSQLIKRAIKDYPRAKLYFRPHPDYTYGNRKNHKNISTRILSKVTILSTEVPLQKCLDIADHIYTITSLVGLEALIRKKKVTTYGCPFYSGWGLTEDKLRIKRRKRHISLEELFAVTYLLYPIYIHPKSNEKVSFEEISYYFLFESILYEDIFLLSNNSFIFKSMCEHGYKYTPFEVMKYIASTSAPTEAKTSKIMEIIKADLNLRDVGHIVSVLIETYCYDALNEYINLCLNHISENKSRYANNLILLDCFFYNLSLSQKRRFGRIQCEIPDLVEDILNTPSNLSYRQSLIKNYLNCAASILRYDLVEKFINIVDSKDKIVLPVQESSYQDDLIERSLTAKTKDGTDLIILNSLTIFPSKAEQNFIKRRELSDIVSNKVSLSLAGHYSSENAGIFLSSTLFNLYNKRYPSAKKEFINYMELCQEKSVVNFMVRMGLLKELLTICNIFIKQEFFDILDDFAESLELLTQNDIKNFNELVSIKAILLNYFLIKNDLNDFIGAFHRLDSLVAKESRILKIKAVMLRKHNRLRESLDINRDIFNRESDIKMRRVLADEITKLKFVIESSNIISYYPQPKLPKGIIFIASQACYTTHAMMTPSYLELKKKGYAVINLTRGMMASDKTGLNFIDKFEGILDLSFTLSESTENLTYKWEIDWNNRNIICEGINFYQGFYEYLSCSIRDFYVDINRPDVYTRLIILINQADKILKICFDIYSGIVRNKMLPVTFISGSSHIPPYSIFRDFARSIKSSKLGFINCNLAYESYFSNLSTKLASTMCVTDMTLYPELRAPFLPRKDKFDRWYSENKSNKEYLDKANSIIKMDRVGLDSNVKEDELIAFIELKKKEGKKIICAFGKVPVDLCVPYDGGPAHKDLGDWINHTVKICSESNDIILLVKPHPHELRPQISLDLVRGFSELISEECSENIIILGHKDINGHTLASYIDLALLYNGSSALELVSQGVPVLMASYFGRLDYPIKLIYPKSRSQYSRFIRSLNYKKPSLEIKNRAAFLICYMGTDEVSILNEYSERQITNDRIFPKWRHEKIKLFLENGDHRMEGVARTIIEKYEK